MKKIAHGFTLIELMVVTLIVATLMAIAVPGYKAYVARAHRSQAQAALLRAAQWMERAATAQGNYPATLAAGLEFVEGGAYTVCLVDGLLAASVELPQPGCPAAGTPELTAAGEANTVSVADPPASGPLFTLVAYRNAAGRNTRNANDKCGDFALDNTGMRGLIGNHSNMGLTNCWGR